MSVVMTHGSMIVLHGLTMGSRVSMLLRRVYGAMPGGFAARGHLLLHTYRPCRAQHGSRHRTPDWDE